MYHVVNPNTTTWSTELTSMALAQYPRNMHIRPVAFDEWVRALSKSSNKIEQGGKLDVDRNPAVRLVDIYAGASKAGQGPRALMSYRAEKASKTLREMGPVNQDWLKNWMVQWGINRVD